jgi:hypothetical protein
MNRCDEISNEDARWLIAYMSTADELSAEAAALHRALDKLAAQQPVPAVRP